MSKKAKYKDLVDAETDKVKRIKWLAAESELIPQTWDIAWGVDAMELRHTFGSRLGMAGVDPRTIQELGGWKSLSMVQRYTHLSPDHKVAAIRKLRAQVSDIFTTPAKQEEAVELKAV